MTRSSAISAVSIGSAAAAAEWGSQPSRVDPNILQLAAELREAGIAVMLPRAWMTAQPALRLAGFHVYTGSNCLSADTIVENFANMARLFRELSRDGTRVLDKLIFGAGFGLPYHAGQRDLDLAAVRDGIAPLVAGLRALP